MATKKIPILLTSSVVAHDRSVALTDTEARIHLALESVQAWLKIAPANCLVLCDGSDFDFSDIVAAKFPHAEIECLHFENDQELVKKYGRGYGEGEIVRYALHHSQCISGAGCFAKCTSKLWVDNFDQCQALWNGRLLCKGVFSNVFSPFRKTDFSYLDTRFYIANTSIYQQYFEDAHLEIRKETGHGLEDCFLDIFKKHSITKSLFPIPPVICGVGGGTGVYYKNTHLRKLKERLRLWLVRFDRNFRQLFSEN